MLLLFNCFFTTLPLHVNPYCVQPFAACQDVHVPEREVWSSHQTRTTKMSKSLSKRFFFSPRLMLSCFFVSKIKQEHIVKMRHAFVPGALYLEAIKLNKENNSSLVVTLVNYFRRISSVFLWDFFFQGFCILPIFWMGYLAYYSRLSAFFIIILY